MFSSSRYHPFPRGGADACHPDFRGRRRTPWLIASLPILAATYSSNSTNYASGPRSCSGDRCLYGRTFSVKGISAQLLLGAERVFLRRSYGAAPLKPEIIAHCGRE